ncbi:unnamed protein product, partial [Protopolystoma xenopodis]
MTPTYQKVNLEPHPVNLSSNSTKAMPYFPSSELRGFTLGGHGTCAGTSIPIGRHTFGPSVSGMAPRVSALECLFSDAHRALTTPASSPIALTGLASVSEASISEAITSKPHAFTDSSSHNQSKILRSGAPTTCTSGMQSYPRQHLPTLSTVSAITDVMSSTSTMNATGTVAYSMANSRCTKPLKYTGSSSDSSTYIQPAKSPGHFQLSPNVNSASPAAFHSRLSSSLQPQAENVINAVSTSNSLQPILMPSSQAPQIHSRLQNQASQSTQPEKKVAPDFSSSDFLSASLLSSPRCGYDYLGNPQAGTRLAHLPAPLASGIGTLPRTHHHYQHSPKQQQSQGLGYSITDRRLYEPHSDAFRPRLSSQLEAPIRGQQMPTAAG